MSLEKKLHDLCGCRPSSIEVICLHLSQEMNCSAESIRKASLNEDDHDWLERWVTAVLEKREAEKPVRRQSTDRLRANFFEEFWESVHLKVGKEAARKAFANAVERLAKQKNLSKSKAASVITTKMIAFASSPQSKPTGHSPVHPATWLNQGRYEDDERAWVGNGEKRQYLDWGREWK